MKVVRVAFAPCQRRMLACAAERPKSEATFLASMSRIKAALTTSVSVLIHEGYWKNESPSGAQPKNGCFLHPFPWDSNISSMSFVSQPSPSGVMPRRLAAQGLGPLFVFGATARIPMTWHVPRKRHHSREAKGVEVRSLCLSELCIHNLSLPAAILS